jgi:hypothetical protein
VTVFDAAPTRIQRDDVAVLLRRTKDNLADIQRLWPVFEELVGVRGRQKFAMVDTSLDSYATCTTIRPDDDPAELGVETGTLPGGAYLRGRLSGPAPGIYDHIGPGMAELITVAGDDLDQGRPLIEYYRRHDKVDLLVPVSSPRC